MNLPEKVKLLNVEVGDQPCGQLLQESQFEFRYLSDDANQTPVGLLLPASALTRTASACPAAA